MEFKDYNRGNIYVPCKFDKVTDPLLSESQTFTAVAAAETNNVYTITTGRGDVWGIEVYVGSDVMADLAAARITLSANGQSVLNDELLVKYSSFYNNSRKAIVIHIPEKAVMTAKITNGSGNPIPLSISYLYYNPYNQSNIFTR